MTRRLLKGTKLVKIFIIVACTLFLVLNIKQLSNNPFKTNLSFDRPEDIAVNDKGLMAVVDNYRTRTILLSSENVILTTIENSELSNVTPSYVEDIAINDKNIFILDYQKSDNGSTINSARVLAFDFDGNYIKTIINEDYTENSKYILKRINCSLDKMYATYLDQNDSSIIYISDITYGTNNIIATYNCDNHVVFDTKYYSSNDSLTILTYDGYVYAYKQNQEIYNAFYDDEHHFSSVEIDDDNRLIVIDHNRHSFGLYDNGWQYFLNEFDGVNSVLDNNNVYGIDNIGNRIIKYNLETNDSIIIKDLTLDNSKVIITYLTWLALILNVGLLVSVFIKFIKSIIKTIKEGQQINLLHKEENILTTRELYGSIFTIVVICLVCSIAILGNYSYNKTLEAKKSSVYNSAYSLKELSPINLGDTLYKIQTQKDYGSKEYYETVQIAKAICMTGYESENSNDLDYLIYRFDLDSDYIMIVNDPYGNYRIGSIINPNYSITKEIRNALDAAKKGELYNVEIKTANNTKMYAVFAPIYDSNNNIVGTIAPLLNVTNVSNSISYGLLVKCLELATLILGLAMVLSETKLAKELYLIQKEKRRNGDYSTLIEIDRTLRITTRMPFYINNIFISLIAIKVLASINMENNAALLALPLTISSVCFGITSSWGGFYFKYNPKKYTRIGLLLEIVGALVFLSATILNNYYVLLVGSFILGSAAGVTKISVNPIKLLGRPVEKRYSMTVFCNVEGGIISAIAASLGSVSRNLFGDVGLLTFLIISCLIGLLINYYFVGDDLIIPKETKVTNKKIDFTIIKQMISFLFRPSIFFVSILGVVPFEFLKLYKTFVLPLVNENFGYPDVFIGIITFGIEISIMFVVPILSRYANKINIFAAVAGTYIILAIESIIFALDGTMTTFVIILITESIIQPVFLKMCTDEFIIQSKLTNQNANDTNFLENISASLGNNIGTFVLSFMFIGGTRYFGIFSAIALLSFALLALPFYLRNKKAAS